MSAIEFVVRNSAGGLQRGTVDPGVNADTIILGAGDDVSLNLQRGHVLSYGRQGQALQVMLVDGRTVTIEGFFGADGIIQNDLFLSSGGQLSEVRLFQGDGNLMLAEYVDEDGFGKWSPDDDLYFIQVASLDTSSESEAGMLAAPLLAGFGGLGGGAAAAGAAALGGGLLLTGGGDPEDQEPDTGSIPGGSDGDTPDAPDGGGENDGGGNGRGTEDDGGDQPDTGGDDGDDEPDDGGDGGDDGGDDGGEEGDGGDVAEITITGGVRSTGDGVNGESWADGVTVTGTGTAGGDATLTVDGETVSFVIPDSGTWSVDVPKTALPEGEYEVGVTVTVTTSTGSATDSDFIDVDTVNEITIDTSNSGGDGTLNAVERTVSGLTVTGTAEAGIDVDVTIGNVTRTTTADADGNWSYTFESSLVQTGEYDLTVTASSTDAAGNTSNASGTVIVDTELNVTFDGSTVERDGTINMVERRDGVTLEGTADAGAEVRVEFRGGAHTVVADSDGIWSADFSAAEIGAGDIETTSTVTVTATDRAGNVARTSDTVDIDTFVNRLSQNQPVEGDDVVNRAEASDGITLTGQVEAGSTVRVSFDTRDSGADGGVVTRTATVSANGNWSVDFAADEIPQGEYSAQVSIQATDAAGNTSSISDSFLVDTAPPEAPEITGHFVASEQGTTEVTTDFTDDGVEVYSFNSGGDGVLQISDSEEASVTRGGDLRFEFDNPVSDGRHIVVASEDASGNTNATYLVLDETGTDAVDVTASGLDGFNIGTIDLTLADKSELTLDKSAIDALSSNDNVLVVKGAIDDTVTFEGTPQQSGTRIIDGETYDIYDLDGSQVLVDDDIEVQISPIV